MYKKITHNIVEEHFAHPAAAEIKAHVDSASTSTRFYHSTSTVAHYSTTSTYHRSTGTSVHHSVVSPAIAPAIAPATKLWPDFNNINQNIAAALIHDSSQVPFLKIEAMKTIDAIGQYVQQQYGVATGRNIVKALTDFEISLINLMTAAAESKNLTDLRTIVEGHISELGKTFSSANPDKWPSTTVVAAIEQYVNLIISALTAQMKKQWESLNTITAETRKLIDNITTVLVSGFPTPMPLEKNP